MADCFDLSCKAARVARRGAAADILRKAGFWTESVVSEWMAVRTALFEWLERRGVAYQGPRDALVSTIRGLPSSEVSTGLVFIYHVATLAEWDETFEVNEEQALEVYTLSARVKDYFAANLTGGEQ